MQAKRLAVVTYEAPSLGDRSYLVHDGDKALVVDPQRDHFTYLSTASELGVEITHVLETHVHNDYVSGGLALARRAGAKYGIASAEPVSFAAERTPLEDGDLLEVGSLRLTVFATPGHTPHHLAFVVEDRGGTSVVLTGGSLLHGTTGRTDLFGQEQAVALAQHQWRSARRLLDSLPSAARVLPTHGFGSFCSAHKVDVLALGETIGTERQRNPAALLDLEAFVNSLLADLPPVPAYYAHMAALNRAGAPEPQRVPLQISSEDELDALVRQGAVMVDVRERRNFAEAHRWGALNLELGANLVTYHGWLVPFNRPFLLLSETAEKASEARERLASIGRDVVAGWAQGSVPESRYKVRDFRELARCFKEGQDPEILDVRFTGEWRHAHINGARNIPLPEVGPRLSELHTYREVWVHCAAGFRAAAAASLLSGAGYKPVLIDDDFANAPLAGLEIVTG